MGKVMARVKLINHDDRIAVKLGYLRPDQVRTLEVEMLVDTGAVMPALPQEIVDQLGLPKAKNRRPVRMADGTVRELEIAELALVILGREFIGNAWVLPAGTVPLLGQIPLEALDLVVVPGSGQVVPNPAHPDQPILDLLSVA
jgi:clan AA aspartic protease